MKWSIFGAAKKSPAAETDSVTLQPGGGTVAPTSAAFDRVTLPASVGVTWGESQDSVMRHIQSQQWSLDSENSTDANVLVRDVDIEGHRGCILAFRFYQRTLFGVALGYQDIAENRAIDEYLRLKSGVVAAYGPPEDDYHWFEEPYAEGDGRSAEAIRAGKAHFTAYWHLDDGRHGIQLKLNSQMHIMVKYEDAEVAERAHPSKT